MTCLIFDCPNFEQMLGRIYIRPESQHLALNSVNINAYETTMLDPNINLNKSMVLYTTHIEMKVNIIQWVYYFKLQRFLNLLPPHRQCNIRFLTETLYPHYMIKVQPREICPSTATLLTETLSITSRKTCFRPNPLHMVFKNLNV